MLRRSTSRRRPVWGKFSKPTPSYPDLLTLATAQLPLKGNMYGTAWSLSFHEKYLPLLLRLLTERDALLSLGGSMTVDYVFKGDKNAAQLHVAVGPKNTAACGAFPSGCPLEEFIFFLSTSAATDFRLRCWSPSKSTDRKHEDSRKRRIARFLIC